MIESLLSNGASAATIVAALMALYTINAWRKQYKFERKATVVAEALILAYQAVDAVKSIRSPLALASEGQSRMRDERESEGQRNALDYAFIPVERLGRRDELFARMRAHRYRMMVELGADWGDAFEPAFKFRRAIRSMFRKALLFANHGSGSGASNDAIEKFHDEFKKLRHDYEDDDDPTTQEMRAMLKRLEDLRATIG